MDASRFSLTRRLEVFVATLLVISQLIGQPANAQYTQEPCDGDVKYWCFMVDWTPQGSGSEIVNWRGHEGGTGFGQAEYWQRWITQDWSYTGTWTFLGGWAPGVGHSEP